MQLQPEQHVILWSDGCTAQNRNVNLSNALLNLSQQLGIVIIQKYLEKGHTQMECDSIHARIETKLKNKPIYTPACYLNIIKEARKNPQAYLTKYVDHTFFKDFSTLKTLKSIRPGYKTGDPTVTDLRALKYCPTGEIYYKLQFADDWQPLTKRTCRNKNVISTETIPQLYNAPPKIKTEKFQHLQDLKHVIPKDFHSFYDKLRH